ncbi:MAG: GatB/YqeY domain-containing protein [Vicinamibacterales bacterium]
MSILADVNARITLAMKAHDAPTLSALRMLKTALTNTEVEKGRTLELGEEHQVVATLLKQRRDSIEQFQKGGRQDLVAKEQFDVALLEGLMPPPVTAGEIEEAVARAVEETGATSSKDMGKVMKAAMAALAGKPVEGKAVNEAVRRRLAG